MPWEAFGAWQAGLGPRAAGEGGARHKVEGPSLQSSPLFPPDFFYSFANRILPRQFRGSSARSARRKTQGKFNFGFCLAQKK